MRSALLLLALSVASCAAPALRVYVLQTPAAPVVSSPVEDLPDDVIELRPVLLPDHLDTRDIVRRAAPDLLVSSRNGRWGDRLSVGIRQALATDLQALLPRSAIVTASPIQPGFRRISLTVSRFDLDATGTLVLEADWIIEATRPPAVLARRRVRLVSSGVGGSDAAQVAAMSGLVGQLAASLASGL